MNFNFLQDQEFLKARQEKRCHYFGALNLPTLSWYNILDELERHIVNGLDYDPKNNMRFILFEMIHPTITAFVNEYSKLDPSLHCGAHGYINLMSKSGENGNHTDGADVLYWQNVGTTSWIVNGVEYILNEGDAIYVPTKMFHSVTSLSPRAGISFGLDYV